MAAVSIYLNFMGQAEAAFDFYRGVFGTDYVMPPMRVGDAPSEGMPPLAPGESDLIMNVQLPILGGVVLMGTDLIPSMGHELRLGNNMTINLEPDSREDTDRLFAALSEGAADVMPLQEMFWGAYWGTLQDRFGVRWMFNFQEG